MGTAFYMSPEQARGKVVDKRTDIWAFGCCLFEALSGHKAFDGEVATDVLGAIIHKEPDWNALSTQAPRRLIEKCLQKTKRDRLQDIGDVRIELEEPASPTRSTTAPWITLFLATLLGMALGAGFLWRLGGDTNRPLPEPKRFAIPLNEGERLGDFFASADNPIAFSPDGAHLVYAAAHGSTSHLYVRDMSTSETRRIPKTNAATDPFFSPDGRWIGFFAKSRLMKVRLAGGEPEVITERIVQLWTGGATWGSAALIVFAGIDGLYVVSADGGEPEQLTTDPRDSLPKFLPDGRRVLFTSALPGDEKQIAIVNIETREQSLLGGLGRSSSGVYLDTGHLVFARGSDLLVTEFEPAGAQVRGEPRLMASGVFTTLPGRAYFDVARNGDLAFVLGNPAARSLVLVDKTGHEEPVTQGQYMHPAFLFEGKRLRVWNGAQDLWEFDIERGAATRTDTFLTSPDGTRRVLYTENELSVETLATGERRVLVANPFLASSWSSDGRWIAYFAGPAGDIGVVRVDGSEPPRILLDSPYNEIWGVFSPDGRYLAHVSDESGRDEVHVVGFPDTSRKWAVTNDECNQPLWWGNEIFFRCGDRAMSLDVETEPEFRVTGKPELMFEGPYDYGEVGDSHWDISPDGERFAMIRLEEASRPRQIEIVLNWRTLVHRAFETSPQVNP